MVGHVLTTALEPYFRAQQQVADQTATIPDVLAALYALYPDLATADLAAVVKVVTDDPVARGYTAIATAWQDRVPLIAEDDELSVLAERAFSIPDRPPSRAAANSGSPAGQCAGRAANRCTGDAETSVRQPSLIMSIRAIIFDRDETLTWFDQTAIRSLETEIATLAPQLPLNAVSDYWRTWPRQWPRFEDEEPVFWHTFWSDLQYASISQRQQFRLSVRSALVIIFATAPFLIRLYAYSHCEDAVFAWRYSPTSSCQAFIER